MPLRASWTAFRAPCRRPARSCIGASCDALRNDALSGRLKPLRYAPAGQPQWPPLVQSFFDSGDAERFLRSGNDGDQIEYLARHGDEVWQWSTSLGGVGLDELSREIPQCPRNRGETPVARSPARIHVHVCAAGGSVWLLSLVLLVYLAHRISRPIQQLTAGLSQLAAGDLSARVEARRDDEIGRAMQALQRHGRAAAESTERLVYLTQLASWQTLARKMAHEVKNSLTPIRLTVEEMLARYGDADRGVHGAGHPDRGGRDREPGAAHARLFAVRRRAAGAARASWT